MEEVPIVVAPLRVGAEILHCFWRLVGEEDYMDVPIGGVNGSLCTEFRLGSVFLKESTVNTPNSGPMISHAQKLL